ncbi:MAG: MBL fold metallo-hydrolase [Candidatus Methanoplasma sp.]|jgi:glyoxylase-like metal-dependent hydrolase (beta-lactamase superfamily II)|nr:MBL fold metallo-hydrolase [Candidatus Methanoplasma sp.]
MTIHEVKSRVPYDCNIFLVIGKRTILVDAGTGEDSGSVIGQIKQILGDRALDQIVLTHMHYDHVGGVEKIVDTFGCDIFAGRGDARALEDGDPNYILSSDFGSSVNPMELTELIEGDVIDIGEHRLRVIETPGHTAGSICLYDEITKSLLSGDTVFNGGVGRMDFPTGSRKDMAVSLRKLSNIEISTLYPGHGICHHDGNAAVLYAMQLTERC